MNETNLIFGVELESELSRRIEQGGYHDGEKITENWNSEYDGSLRTTRFTYGFATELVSREFKASEFWTIAWELASFLENEDIVISVNESMGTHIHFSFDYNKRDNLKLGVGFARILRKKIKQLIVVEFGEDCYNAFKKQYNREYAKKLTIRNYASSRYLELARNKGYEWRGFNLMFVQHWIDKNDAYYNYSTSDINNLFFYGIWLGIQAIQLAVKEYLQKGAIERTFRFDIEPSEIELNTISLSYEIEEPRFIREVILNV